MRVNLPILMLFGSIAGVAVAEQSVTPEQVREAEELFNKLGAENYEERQHAAKKLETLFAPRTQDRVDFWLSWRNQKLKETKDPEQVKSLNEISPLELIESTGWRFPAYQNEQGNWVLHGTIEKHILEHLSQSTPFVHGKIHGTVIGYFMPNTKKQPGQVMTRTEYQDGRLHGRSVSYFRSGQIRTECAYVDGLLHGESIQYDESGKEVGRFAMKNGCGLERSYYDTGQRLSEVDFKNGLPSGEARAWDRNGTLIAEGGYKYLEDSKSSVAHGPLKRWFSNANGELELQCDLVFENGIVMSGWAKARDLNGQERQLAFKSGKVFEQVLSRESERLTPITSYSGFLMDNETVPTHIVIKDSKIWTFSMPCARIYDGVTVPAKLGDDSLYLKLCFEEALEEYEVKQLR